MTTNHYERLDPALIRPGRVDIHELLGDAAGEQAERLFVKFYGRGASDPARSLSAAATTTRVNVAGDDELDSGRSIGGRGKEGEARGVHGLPVQEAELEDEEVARLGKEASRIIEEGLQRGKSISMAALQGLFIRHGPRDAVQALKEVV